MTSPIERAREAAAKAIYDRYESLTHWVSTLKKPARPFEDRGISQVHRLDANAAIDAFLASLAAEGMVVVPKEASRPMMIAGQAEITNPSPATDDFGEVWSAMIDAASQGDGG